jgi:uncharacterized protein Yka (UPF0111/DUF47 family)
VLPASLPEVVAVSGAWRRPDSFMMTLQLMPLAKRKRPANAFVVQFHKIAAHAAEAGGQLTAALRGTPEEALARILEIEHNADEAVREIHRLVDKTFIAPYDKRDIVNLGHRLDDIVDAMRTVARRIVSYQVLQGNGSGALVARATGMCELIARSITTLKQVVDHMPAFNHDQLREAVRVIDEIEDEADEALAQAIRAVFPDPNQPLTAAMLAWRDIFRLLERTTDHASHAIGVIISIARQEGN